MTPVRFGQAIYFDEYFRPSDDYFRSADNVFSKASAHHIDAEIPLLFEVTADL